MISRDTNLMEEVLTTGAIATIATTAATAICGERENSNAIAPINAVSHICWGDQAARQETPSLQYTAVGALLNAAAVTSWAAVHELVCEKIAPKRDVGTALVTGAAISALAWFTDYRIVPKRLTPGFEKRLSNPSLFAIYSTLALSLAAGRLARSRSV